MVICSFGQYFNRTLLEVRLARIERYNRILKSRMAKRGIIVEHDILNEYLSFAKVIFLNVSLNSLECFAIIIFGGKYF